ncbi:hypothetical protein KM043_013050 [Ampulex compressa]|nr:hypothetical protein KM043_013050 [Ampulex compressa]
MKTKRPAMRRKAKQLILDCIEDESEGEPENVPAKVDYRKCKKKKKKRVIQSLVPRISLTDILLSRIQPSIEQRALLTDRHFACLMEKTSKTALSVAKDSTKTARPKDRHKRKTRTKRTGTNDERAIRDEKDENKISISEVEKVSGEDKFAEETQSAEKTKGDKRPDRDKKKTIKVMERKKDKFWCNEITKKTKYKMDETTDSECHSICSFDSEICLAGLVLTAEDKRSIEENRQRVLSSDYKHGR